MIYMVSSSLNTNLATRLIHCDKKFYSSKSVFTEPCYQL